MRFHLVKMKGVLGMHSIMNIFTKEKTDNVQTITTLEIAEMMETEHWKILRKLDGQEKEGKHIKGYVEILGDNEIVVTDYFIKSSYKTEQNKEMPCYEVTKLGCDFLANKFTGEKGVLFTARYVKRFEEMESYIKEENNDAIAQGLYVVKFIADDMRVSDSSRLFMYENYCKDVGIPTGFLPKYTENGNREQCSATELLNRNSCDIKAVKFNQLMIAAGYMELRERPSSKGITKKYKALTDKGLKYGVNLVSNKNQKECQPYYYADTFMELYKTVTA